MSSNAPQVVERSKFSFASPTYQLDVGLASVQVWEADATIQASEFRRPPTDTESSDGADHSTGYVYQNGAAAGQTGADEPAWATSGTISDGSCTWTPLAPPASGQDVVSSATADLSSPPDTALTVGTLVVDKLSVGVPVSGGTSGQTYVINVTVTMQSGLVLGIQLVVTVQ